MKKYTLTVEEANELFHCIVCGIIIYRVYTKSGEQKLDALNEEGARLIGDNVENIIKDGLHVYELVDEDDRDYLRNILEKEIFQKTMVPFEFHSFNRMGENKWIAGHARSFGEGRDHKGPYRKVQVSFIDITDRKEKELSILRDAEKDGLTGVENRAAYEKYIDELCDDKDKKIMIFAADINGLKITNDDFGHCYGDELIKGSAEVISKSMSGGRCFRIGGDEFVGIIENPEISSADLKKKIDHEISEWKGKLIKHLSISYGIAAKEENPNASVRDLIKIADKNVMEMKEQYYRKHGVDRRLRQSACDILLEDYIKILKVNLTTDKFEIVQMDWGEKGINQGFHTHYSRWMRDFGLTGNIDENQIQEFNAYTDRNFLQKSFDEGKKRITFNYNRKYEKTFIPVNMEIIPSKEYRAGNRIIFLYVRRMDI